MCAAPAARLARVLRAEDGFYTLSVARQIAVGGGITIDGHTATNGFQPLWGSSSRRWPRSPAASIGTLRPALILSTLLWLGFIALMAALAREHARRRGMDGRLAAALAATSPPAR